MPAQPGQAGCLQPKARHVPVSPLRLAALPGTVFAARMKALNTRQEICSR